MGGQPTVAFFSMEGEPHSEKFYPEWDRLVATCDTGVLFKKIDEKDPMTYKYDIPGFPTILLLDAKGYMIKEYGGDLSADGICEWTKNEM